jgi:hypothetical protein
MGFLAKGPISQIKLNPPLKLQVIEVFSDVIDTTALTDLVHEVQG